MTRELVPKSRWVDATNADEVLDRQTKIPFNPGYIVPCLIWGQLVQRRMNTPLIHFTAIENNYISDLDLIIQGVFYDS